MAKRKTTWRGLRAAFRKGVGDARIPGRAFYSGFGKSQTREHLAYQRGYEYVARGRSAAIRRSGARPLQWNPTHYGFSPGGPSNIGASTVTVRAHIRAGRPVRQSERHLSKSSRRILSNYRRLSWVGPSFSSDRERVQRAKAFARKTVREQFGLPIEQAVNTRGPKSYSRTVKAVRYRHRQIFRKR